VSDVYEFEAAVTNSSKPMIFICHDVNGLKDILEMAAAIAGSRENLEQKPFVISYPEPTSPLVHTKEALEKVLYTASYGIPMIYTPCPMAGATSPVTMAGTLVQMNAETMVGLVLGQLQRKGSPFIMGGVLTIMDMSSTTVCYGAPEMSLLLAGCSDLAHYYRLPTFGTAGCSDSKLPDQQAAIEATFSCLINVLSGLNLIHDPGFLEGAMIGSWEMLVMTDEIAGMVKRFMKGIPVNDETIAEDVIDAVGPGGHFLEQEHTRKHFRDSLWNPSLMDRQPYEVWAADGKKSMGDRIKEKIAEILGKHKPIPLPADVLAKIRKIRERSEKQRVKK
jgi:trimethylamine--corrinoid protein Co-methyltransferase